MHITTLHAMNFGSHFRAQALRSPDIASMIAPFLGVDHAYMSAPTFPLHRHAGISAVSYVFEDAQTAILNQDSMGNKNLIHAGGLHWAYAGSGMVHQEDPLETGKTVHQLQIFIDNETASPDESAYALSLEPEVIPTIEQDGARIRVVMGRFANVVSPLNPPNDVHLYDITLAANAQLNVPILANHNAFVLMIRGELSINGTTFSASGMSAPVLPAQGVAHDISLSATSSNSPNETAQCVVFMGKPRS